MTDILPCPNPKCRGECQLVREDDFCFGGSRCHVQCFADSRSFRRGCGYIGPRAATKYKNARPLASFDPAAEAIVLHNAMPREEEWRRIAEWPETGAPEWVEWIDVVARYRGVVSRSAFALSLMIPSDRLSPARWRPRTPPKPPEES